MYMLYKHYITFEEKSEQWLPKPYYIKSTNTFIKYL